MSYLQYLNKSTAVLRASLKEPMKSKALANGEVNFASFPWSGGVRGPQYDISNYEDAVANATKRGVSGA